MPSQTRKLPFVGIAFVLALLLSAYTLAPKLASAHTAQDATPYTSGVAHFTETVYSSNRFGDSMYMNNVYTNNKPYALLFVTPNYNPGGVGGTYDNHPVGVWYNNSLNEWAIFNEDGATMPLNASFNVLVVPTPGSFGGTVFVQTAAPYNISGDSTFINPATTTGTGTASAQLLITQNWNPGGIGGTYNPHNVGVWYNTSAKEWAIFNEDGATMTSGANFNVMVGPSASSGGTEFLQTTTSSNRSGDSTYINNTATNSKPNGVLFVTPNFNPGVVSGVYDNHPIGVWYNTGSGEWAIFNEDGVSMPISAAFNVLAFPF
jgi:hypothetical protein